MGKQVFDKDHIFTTGVLGFVALLGLLEMLFPTSSRAVSRFTHRIWGYEPREEHPFQDLRLYRLRGTIVFLVAAAWCIWRVAHSL